jgi:hypothetical protein
LPKAAAGFLSWDENDYSAAPSTNQVLTIVDTNYDLHGVNSNQFFAHFSLERYQSQIWSSL